MKKYAKFNFYLRMQSLLGMLGVRSLFGVWECDHCFGVWKVRSLFAGLGMRSLFCGCGDVRSLVENVEDERSLFEVLGMCDRCLGMCGSAIA